jgi:L-aspartate oxidase
MSRERAGLQRLRSDPHPLARLVAACAMLREESRGAHFRADFPHTDPGLDDHHAVVRDGETPAFEPWT